MNQVNIQTRVMAIVLRDYPAAQPELAFDVMGMDSLEYIEFVNEVERACGVDIPPMVTFDTPQQAISWVLKATEGNHAVPV